MKIVFMGTPTAAVPSLERCLSDGHDVVAVYTQPDRPSGRGNKIKSSAVKEFALANGIAVYQPIKIKISETLDEFRSHAADVAVVVAYGRILPVDYLTAFPHGAVNVHFSLLPKYRGAAPVNWAIVNGEARSGVTTMRMDAGLDTGDILLQSDVLIGNEETSVELMERLAGEGAGLLSETLKGLDAIEPKPQEHEMASYAPIMKREDGLINWQASAVDIANSVRGFQPFPTAFSYYRGSKLTIWRAVPADAVGRADAGPGQLVFPEDRSLQVSCGGGTVLRIEELQPEGKRRMSAKDFANGAQPQLGEKLGE